MDKKLVLGLTFIVIALAGVYSYFEYKEKNKYNGLLICSKYAMIDTNASFSSLLDANATKQFYAKHCANSSSLAWFDSDLKLDKHKTTGLIDSIAHAHQHGLFRDKYHFETITKQIASFAAIEEFQNPIEEAHIINTLDVFLTDAYIALFNDSYYGITDWKKFKKLQKEYAIEAAKKIKEEKIQKLIEANATDVEVEDEVVRKFEWEIPRKNNLIAEDELLKALEKNRVFESLEQIHPQFKEYKKFVELLEKYRIDNNKEMVKKLLINMERYRWIKNSYDDAPKYININIPTMHLQLIENAQEAFSMRVIVGKPQRPTPILEGVLSYAILNPYWTAPTTIVTQDILKKRADNNMTGYLESHNMKVFFKDKNGKREINPKDVNWTIYKGKTNIPFVFRAEPGKDNPLGSVKFTFANKYSVYMHDTDKKEFFAHDYRAFSSGCVRLSDPLKLLAYFLEKESVDIAALNKNNKPEYAISLKAEIPVLFRYMTIGLNKSMQLEQYEDIYGYDETHIASIKDIDKIL